jgi:hypothetical protein
MATLRKKGGTLRETLYSTSDAHPPTRNSGPGQGKSWETRGDLDPKARSFATPFGGGPVSPSVPSRERDSVYVVNGGNGGTDIERLRPGD